MEEQVLKKFQVDHKQFHLSCSLFSNSLNIEITSTENESKYYYTIITEDSFPDTIKYVFVTSSELYQFIADPNATQCFEITNPSELILLVPIRNNIRRVPIYLSEKQMTHQMMLQRKVAVLSAEVARLKTIERDFNSAKLKGEPGENAAKFDRLVKQNDQMRKLIISLQRRLEQAQNHQSLSPAKEGPGKQIEYKLESMKKEFTLLQTENADYKAKIIELNAQIKTLEMIIQELQVESNKSLVLIKDMTEGPSQRMGIEKIIIDPEGSLQRYQPLPTSINFTSYQFKDSILTKRNIETNNLQAKLLPCYRPVPKNGRYFYKLKMKTLKSPINIRLGVVGRQSLGIEPYLNLGDQDSVMYNNLQGTFTIHTGSERYQGFSLNTGDTLIVAIDQVRKTVEWHLQGEHLFTSNFTSSMKIASNIYFFIQLSSNGDQIEILQS